ncbi:MAG: ADP-ribosylglycohydrolase family protein [Ktedonobacteraceae bacterium]
MNTIYEERLARARCSLEGLSVGDALGDRFFLPYEKVEQLVERRELPPAPWQYSDDTQMALSIYSNLLQHGEIIQDALAESFAAYYDPGRGYGPSMHRQLRSIRNGKPWREAATSQFEGQGSYGNGAAMRIAPLGAYFADALEDVSEQARLSAEVTHAHLEGIAGAIAVAVGAAWAWRLHNTDILPTSADFLDRILPFVPQSEVSMKLRWARDTSPTTPAVTVADMLGNGSRISAQDTVPFALWCAGTYLDSYEEAIWQTLAVFGDIDTNCAIVGGIVALYCGAESIPPAWLAAREPLPAWI